MDAITELRGQPVHGEPTSHSRQLGEAKGLWELAVTFTLNDLFCYKGQFNFGVEIPGMMNKVFDKTWTRTAKGSSSGRRTVDSGQWGGGWGGLTAGAGLFGALLAAFGPTR